LIDAITETEYAAVGTANTKTEYVAVD